MITVKIDEADLLDMLVYRVKHWTDDRDVLKLYEQYYDFNKILRTLMYESLI